MKDMSLLEYVLQNGTSLWKYNIIDVISVGIAVVLAIFAIWRYGLAKQTLSLNAFMKALDIFADETARKSRRQVFAFFPDYTEEDDAYEKWKKRAIYKKKMKKEFLIKSRAGIEQKLLQIKRLR